MSDEKIQQIAEKLRNAHSELHSAKPFPYDGDPTWDIAALARSLNEVINAIALLAGLKKEGTGYNTRWTSTSEKKAPAEKQQGTANGETSTDSVPVEYISKRDCPSGPRRKKLSKKRKK